MLPAAAVTSIRIEVTANRNSPQPLGKQDGRTDSRVCLPDRQFHLYVWRMLVFSSFLFYAEGGRRGLSAFDGQQPLVGGGGGPNTQHAQAQTLSTSLPAYQPTSLLLHTSSDCKKVLDVLVLTALRPSRRPREPTRRLSPNRIGTSVSKWGDIATMDARVCGGAGRGGRDSEISPSHLRS